MSFEVTFSVCGRPKAYAIGVRQTNDPKGKQEYHCVLGNCDGWDSCGETGVIPVMIENDLKNKKHPFIFLRDILNTLPLEEIVEGLK